VKCMRGHSLLDLESRRCFDFFWLEANTDKSSKGYGLIRDRAGDISKTDSNISSIASVGFGLSAFVIGVERGWITREQGRARAEGTLDTLCRHAEQVNGFFYHFLNMETAKRFRRCEVSLIDTAIAICGAITAGEYFGGAIKEKADFLYQRVDWNWYRDPQVNRFFMGYTPEKGFSGWWDFYAEQLMAYILGAGSLSHPVPGDMFYSFIRYSAGAASQAPGQPGSADFIHSWFGSLFTHQFSHAWVDFRNKKDRLGMDWWENSVKASLANRDYCVKMSRHFKTLHENSWGLTPCSGPWGYQGRYGAAPSDFVNAEHIVDGTVPPAGAAGSIPFTPEVSMEALRYYYEKHPALWGRYGFFDAYNLDVIPGWYAGSVIGIDKGITLLMIENYRTGMVWDLFMKNDSVQLGLKNAGLQDTSVQTNIA
jgi:hypothetical protein